MITAKTADLFQGRQLGAILGVISIGRGIGAAAGARASGLIFDLSWRYRLGVPAVDRLLPDRLRRVLVPASPRRVARLSDR